MKERLQYVLSFALFGALSVQAQAGGLEDQVKGRYLVGYDPAVIERLGVTPAMIEPQLLRGGLQLKNYLDEIDVAVADTIDGAPLSIQAVQAVRSLPGVEFLEKDHIISVDLVPNDADWRSQRHLRRLRVERAWQTTTGSDEVVVAVIDTGIDYGHPELASRLYSIPGEIPGNGRDDDGNGYTDDVNGWDFYSDDSRPLDENRHGTHVAGIIGAEANNGAGISGVNWRVKLLPVRFLGPDGRGSHYDGVRSIIYAAKSGARIINASWGSSSGSAAQQRAVSFAYERGAVLVAAAGNNEKSNDVNPHYPSAHSGDGLVAVASSKSDGELSGFSNFGHLSVHVAAPGSSILSTVPGGGFRRLSGTSMAAPMVSGVAALMLAARPGLSALELRNGLLNATALQREYQGMLATAGEVRADRALEQLEAGFQVWPARITIQQGDSVRMSAFDAGESVSWSVSDPDVARIDRRSGRVTGRNHGKTQVTATTASGRVAQNTWLRVLPKTPDGGCGRGDHLKPLRRAESNLLIFSFLLPFLAAAGVRIGHRSGRN